MSKGLTGAVRRKDFPALQQEVRGKPLVYLDSAATTQKPRVVIDALVRYYEHDNANVRRGVHALGERSTLAYEAARQRAADFLGAGEAAEVLFTRGTTEGINLVAQSWGRAHVRKGDRILLTELEHHSNLVPWQMLAAEKEAELVFLPVDPGTGTVDDAGLESILGQGVRLFAFTAVSNTLGTVNPVGRWCALAGEKGVATLVDAAQAAGHRPLDVRAWGCDFMACSGHKMCGPMGIGLLFGRRELLEAMPPWQGGGEMISKVEWRASRWNVLPNKFEAGTPHVAGAVGLHAAMDYLDGIGRETVRRYDQQLAAEAWERLRSVPGCRVWGPDPKTGAEHAGAVTFDLPGVHAHDVVTLADAEGVALRGGHHCNQPLMRKLGVPATARASFYVYNTTEELEQLEQVVRAICKRFDR